MSLSSSLSSNATQRNATQRNATQRNATRHISSNLKNSRGDHLGSTGLKTSRKSLGLLYLSPLLLCSRARARDSSFPDSHFAISTSPTPGRRIKENVRVFLLDRLRDVEAKLQARGEELSMAREQNASDREVSRGVFLSCLVVSCLVVSCLVVSCRVVSCRVLSCLVVSCRVLF